jgi:hypothetical protein
MSFNWFARKALNRSYFLAGRAAAMRASALRLGWLMHKRRSEIFRMAKDATGIDPGKTLDEAEVETLVNWIVDIRKAILERKEGRTDSPQ